MTTTRRVFCITMLHNQTERFFTENRETAEGVWSAVREGRSLELSDEPFGTTFHTALNPAFVVHVSRQEMPVPR